LKEFFIEYGDINYCLITKDKVTKESRGTAFIQFKKPESAKLVIEAAYQSELYNEKKKF